MPDLLARPEHGELGGSVPWRDRELADAGNEANVGLAASGHVKALATGGALHVPAKVVAKFVGADDPGTAVLGALQGVELVGLEPTTSSLPARRYFQLSYSPERVIGGEV